jgi:hypothetical protein
VDVSAAALEKLHAIGAHASQSLGVVDFFVQRHPGLLRAEHFRAESGDGPPADPGPLGR